MEYFDYRELEEYLKSHPAVSDAAVVPGPAAGRDVRAFVVPRPGVFDPDRLLAFFRDRLCRLQLTGEIEYRESLPVSATGKLYRRELAALAASSSHR